MHKWQRNRLTSICLFKISYLKILWVSQIYIILYIIKIVFKIIKLQNSFLKNTLSQNQRIKKIY